MSGRVREGPRRVDRFRLPRRRDPRADARARRRPPGRRGAGPVARGADGRLPRGVPPGGRPAATPGGGCVSLEFERVITANWGDDSVRSLAGYEAKGGYAGLRTAL